MWIQKIEVNSGTISGVTTENAQKVKELECENPELKCANEILKKAAASLAVAEPTEWPPTVEFYNPSATYHPLSMS